MATLQDGSVLVMNLAGDGPPRIAGTFVGPIGALDAADEWALASRPLG